MSEIIEVEAEELPQRTVENAIKPELVVFDKYEARINELKEKYSAIKINGIEDKAGYESARIAAGELRTTRTGSEEDRKSAKAFYLECGRAIDKKATWIENEILKLETPIKNQMIEIDKAKEKIKADKENEDIERLKVRHNLLVSSGATFDGIDYIVSGTSFSQAEIKAHPEEYFQNEVVSKLKENPPKKIVTKTFVAGSRTEIGKDKDNYHEMVAHIKATPMHEMRSGKYRALAAIIRDFIADLK